MGFETYVKMPSKRVSLSLSLYIYIYRGPVWDRDGVCLPGFMTEKKKYIWVPLLDPGGIKILSLEAIWNFSKGTGLP